MAESNFQFIGGPRWLKLLILPWFLSYNKGIAMGRKVLFDAFFQFVLLLVIVFWFLQLILWLTNNSITQANDSYDMHESATLFICESPLKADETEIIVDCSAH